MAKKQTREEFIEKARKVHGDKYGYDKVVYVNSRTEVIITCPIHGDFPQIPRNHTLGKGCKECGKYINKKPYKDKEFLTSDERITRAKQLYNDFYVYDKTDFLLLWEKLKLHVPNMGIGTQLIICMLLNDVVVKNALLRKKRHDKESFIAEYIKRFGNKYDFSKVEYKDPNSLVTLICPKHGDFTKMARTLLYSSHECPHCAHVTSSLENEIEEFLKENRIEYIHQHKFSWLGPYQSVDFYLPKHNTIIECQGKQHFGEGGWTKSYDFEKQKKLDERKWRLCNENGVKLLYYSNKAPNFDYFDKVFTDKEELLKAL